MPLTDLVIRTAKPSARATKLFDGGGLYLLVSPKGGKWWRIKFRLHGKEKLLSLGTYPIIPLRVARERRDEVKRQLANGIDPSAARAATKSVATEGSKLSFQVIAEEWHLSQMQRWVPSHAQKIKSRLAADVFPHIGKLLITEVEASHVLLAIRQIEQRGAHDVSRRVLQYVGAIFRYAVATGRAPFDVTVNLRGALAAKPEVQHRASVTNPADIAELLVRAKQYSGSPITRLALLISAHVFLRPGELRFGQWSEVDFKFQEWRIPAPRMKMKKDHIVPLSSHTIQLLEELKLYSGHGTLMFPSESRPSQPISENTLNQALRRLGYSKDKMTAHGFRSIASTTLNNQGWNRDAIERQLSHEPLNKVRSAYNDAQYLHERKLMMSEWSKWLESLSGSA